MITIFVASLATFYQAPNPEQLAKASVVMVTTLPSQVPGRMLHTRSVAGNQPADLRPDPIRDRKGLASGILLDGGNQEWLYVVTMAHAISKNDQVWVHTLTSDNQVQYAQCPVIHYDSVRDLAILAVTREKDLESRAIKIDRLETNTRWISKFVAETPFEKRGVIVIGHIQGEGGKGAGLSWRTLGGHIAGIQSVGQAMQTILPATDHSTVDPAALTKDCLHVVAPGVDHGVSGGPVYLSNYSKILGLVWMGTRTEPNANVICVPAAWINELPLANPRAMTVPATFQQHVPAPALASSPAIRPPGGGIRSFTVLPIPRGADLGCYMDDDYLINKFNSPTLRKVLSMNGAPQGRGWWDVTQPRTGFSLVVPRDYKLAEQTLQVGFFREPKATQVLALTAQGTTGDEVRVHLYSRFHAGRGNDYERLLAEVVRYRRGILDLGLLTNRNGDDDFQPSAADRYCLFDEDVNPTSTRVFSNEYMVGFNDVRVWRLYVHTDKNGQSTGKSTLSVIGIRGSMVVAAATTFRNEEWNPNAPLEFATRFFMLATYSFVD